MDGTLQAGFCAFDDDLLVISLPARHPRTTLSLSQRWRVTVEFGSQRKQSTGRLLQRNVNLHFRAMGDRVVYRRKFG